MYPAPNMNIRKGFFYRLWIIVLTVEELILSLNRFERTTIALSLSWESWRNGQVEGKYRTRSMHDHVLDDSQQ